MKRECAPHSAVSAPGHTFDVLVADGSLAGAFADAPDDDNDGVAQLNTPDGAWAVHYLRNLGGISMVRLSGFDPVPEPPRGVWSPSLAWGRGERMRRGAGTSPQNLSALGRNHSVKAPCFRQEYD